MRFGFLCLSWAMLSSGAALGQGTEPCGSVTAQGECDGTDAIWCNTSDNTLQRAPCADLAGDGSVPAGVCEVYAGLGSWCAFNDGDPCQVLSDGNIVDFACVTDTSGCVDGVCQPDAGTCTPDADQENPATTCVDGSTLQLACRPWGQMVGVSCSTFGPAASCSADICSDVAEGESCVEGVSECAAGLVCTAEVCDGGGGEEGEGEGAGDGACSSDGDCGAGEVCTDGVCGGAPDAPPLCSHASPSNAPPVAASLVMLAVISRLVRRRAYRGPSVD